MESGVYSDERTYHRRAFVAEARRNLALVRRAQGQDSASYRGLAALYTEVAEALGCRRALVGPRRPLGRVGAGRRVPWRQAGTRRSAARAACAGPRGDDDPVGGAVYAAELRRYAYLTAGGATALTAPTTATPSEAGAIIPPPPGARQLLVYAEVYRPTRWCPLARLLQRLQLWSLAARVPGYRAEPRLVAHFPVAPGAAIVDAPDAGAGWSGRDQRIRPRLSRGA